PGPHPAKSRRAARRSRTSSVQVSSSQGWSAHGRRGSRDAGEREGTYAGDNFKAEFFQLTDYITLRNFVPGASRLSFASSPVARLDTGEGCDQGEYVDFAGERLGAELPPKPKPA